MKNIIALPILIGIPTGLYLLPMSDFAFISLMVLFIIATIVVVVKTERDTSAEGAKVWDMREMFQNLVVPICAVCLSRNSPADTEMVMTLGAILSVVMLGITVGWDVFWHSRF